MESSCDESAVAVLDERARAARARALQPGRPAPGLRRRGAGTGLARPRAAPAAAGAQRARRRRDRAGRARTGWPTPPGPGLIGALLTGAALARSLAFGWRVPAIGVHHLEGHLLAPLLERRAAAVSARGAAGLRRPHDADRSARHRRLPAARARPATMRPARPSTRPRSCWACPIRAARSWPQLAAHGRAGRLPFPRPMLDRPGLEFSFSGLKTAVLHAVRGRDARSTQRRADVARGVQEAIVETLVAKALRALDAHRPRRAGGLRRRRRQPRAARAARRGGWRRAAAACTIRASSSAPTMRR